MRVRRPVLPALTAVLAGALVAGVATALSGPAPSSGADQDELSLSAEERPDPNGGVGRVLPDDSSSAQPAPAPTTPLTTAPPVTTSSTPPPEPPPPPPAEPPVTVDPPATSLQESVVSIVNSARGDAGCGPLSVDDQLTAAAQGHAEDMAARSYFEHTTPEGVTFDQRIRSAGYSQPGAENIARGARTAEDVMNMWMESPGHRRNILNCDLNTIGVGLDRDGFYWVQNFGY